MTTLKSLLSIAAGLSVLLLAPSPITAQAALNGAVSGALTVEQVSAEPDMGSQVGSGADQQAPTLRWSADGARVAWLNLVTPPPNSPVKTPQQEIWTFGTDTAHAPAVLVSSTKVTASLRGTDTPRRRSIDDDDDDNPDLLKDFAWSPDHASLLLVNAQSLAWLDLGSGKSRILLTGEDVLSDAAISPDGKTVSFLRNHRLWTIGIASGTAHPFLLRAPQKDVLQGEVDWPYRNELHLQHGYAWSPDSSRLAYFETDDRAVDKYAIHTSDGTPREIIYPKPGGALPMVRVFVKPIAGGLPIEIHLESYPSLAKGFYLPHFTWLPDGRHLAIERLDRSQQTLELFVADAMTGKAQLILTEKDKYWINLSNDLIFLKDGKRFLWSSERTGYRHLYLYDMEGKQLAQLTHGDWEVTQLNAVDEAQSRVYFTATQKSPLERHLYSVNLKGDELTQITQLPGTHEAHFSPDNAGYVDSYSSHATRPRLELAQINAADASQMIASTQAAALPGLQRVEFVTVKLHMDAEVNAFLIKPPAFDATKKYPVIVYLAGGPGEQLVRDVWGGATGLWMQLMAQKGYIIFAMDNQGTAGRGHFFEEPLHLRFAAQEMIDQRDGLTYLSQLPYVDFTRLGVCGWGYGGFLVTHAMMDRPIAFKAGFAGAPIVDWHFYDSVFAERYLGDSIAYQDGWLASTAVENAHFFKGPLLIAQGTADEFVHMENTLTLQDHLVDAGKSADMLLLPDRGHAIEDAPARLVLFRRMTEFFTGNL